MRVPPSTRPARGLSLTCSLITVLLVPALYSPSPGNPTSIPGVGVQIKDHKFGTPTLQIPAGTTVTWTDLDNDTHNVTISQGPEQWVSPVLTTGLSTSFTFIRPGNYHYFCEWHPFMQADITVTPQGNSATSWDPYALQTFQATGKSVRGRFLDYWQRNGGLAQQGYPISEELTEKSDTDGKFYTVQYFERAIFEQHPENKAPYDVLLSLLGTQSYKQKYPNGAPGQRPNSTPGSVLFKETGKRLGGRFLDYWNTHGGLAQQGYPITNEFLEKSELDGKTYLVQYFERAVFEYHPENKPPYDVLLSQLGTFNARSRLAVAQTGPVYQAGISSGPEHYPLMAGPHAAAGVNAWIYDQDPAPVLGWTRELGVKWVLHQLSWYHIENRKGVYDWALIDGAVDALHNAGVNIILNVVHSPPWASSSAPGYPNDPADLAQFMTLVAQRYKGKVAGYEIWNEPNHTQEAGIYVSSSRYAGILEAGYNAVKAVDPKAVIILGALTPNGINDPYDAVDDVVFLQRLYAYNGGELKSYFDVLGVHPGSYANPPDAMWPTNPGTGQGWNTHPSFYFRRVEQLRQVMVENGDARKQIWLTEFGWDSMANPPPGFEYAKQNSEQEQAYYIAQAFRMGRDLYPWMGPMMVFGLNFSLPSVAPDPTDERIGWSLLRRDGTRRPSFFAVKAYATGH